MEREWKEIHSYHQLTAEARILLSPVPPGLLGPSKMMRYKRERFTFLHTMVVRLKFVSHASISFSGNVLVVAFSTGGPLELPSGSSWPAIPTASGWPIGK